MKKKNFMLWITLFVISASTMATTNKAHSNQSQPIIGFEPIMKSIGAMLNPQKHHLFDEMGKPIVNVGTTLFVPSAYCVPGAENIEKNQINREIGNETRPFFDFFDKDNDSCLNAHSHELNWFILDSKNTSWQNIQRWEDLNSTHINPQNFPNALIPAGTIPQSPYTQALLVPPQAEGYRIGFTYTPLAETGNPQSGQEVKVWDLSYFFGQQEPSTAGNQTEPNPGVKLHEIEMVSGGGIVEADYSLPEIKNLTMNGTFWVGESLEAKFDFESNSQNGDSEDLSRLWWGNAGTTQTQAYFQNQNYSTTHQSPVLTADNINRIYEVSVLPIKKEGNYFVVGAPVTVKSDNENNNFTAPPSIQSLAFSNPLKINSPISATYQFNHGGASHAVDKSTYHWEYQNTSGTWVNLSKGNIKQSGVVPASPALTQAQAGLNLRLTIEPKDQLGRSGDPVSLSEQLEALSSLDLSPAVLSLNIGDTHSQKITASAIYSKGTVIQLADTAGRWTTNNYLIAVNNKGEVKVDVNNTTEQSGTITFTYQNKTNTASVKVNPSPPSISDLRINSGNYITPNTSVTATYKYNDGGKIDSHDKSTYRWYAKQTPASNEQPMSSGTIGSNSGTVFSPNISMDKAGWFIYLEVTPRDNFGRTGNTQLASQKVTNSPSITNVAFTNHSNGELKIINQANVAYQFHNIEGSQDQSVYRFYFKDDFGVESTLSSGIVGATSGQNSGSIKSPNIPVDKAGLALYVEITPKDAAKRSGTPVTIQMPIESLLSIDFTPTFFYVLIPTQFTATATYSQKSQANVTALGKWSSKTAYVSTQNDGIVLAGLDLVQPPRTGIASIKFEYGNLHKEKELSVYSTNVTDVYGSIGPYTKLLSRDNDSGYGFRLWGESVLDSFRNSINTILVGGTSGSACGPFNPSDACKFRPSQVKQNTRINLITLNGDTIQSMGWENKNGTIGIFVGSRTEGNRRELSHLVRGNTELYGIYVYSSQPPGNSSGYIRGIRFVYTTQ